MKEKDRYLKGVEEAKDFASSQLSEVVHTLADEDSPLRRDTRTLLLFERAYLQGLTDMAVHLNRTAQGVARGVEESSIVQLALIVTQERLGYLTGNIETGILHVNPVGFDMGNKAQGVPGNQDS